MTRSPADIRPAKAAQGQTSAASPKGGADPVSNQRTFVLVHGAWHGGWCWNAVATRLRAAGHRVYTPTQTGLGERRHLLSREITLDTFATDITNVIEFEDLHDVVLVGHSFAGLTISAVADRMPERLRHLVYLDSLLVTDNGAPFDSLPKDVVAARIKAADDSSGGLSLPNPAPSAFGLTDPDHQAMIASRLTPHPLSTYQSKLGLKHPLTNGVPATYVVCTDPIYAPLESSRAYVRAQNWDIRELATGHDAMIAAPDDTTDLLMELAG